LVAAVSGSLLIGSLIGSLLPSASAQVVGTGVAKPSAEVGRQQAAQALAPYKIKEARSLPAGAYLDEVSWLVPGAETPGAKTFSVDLIYRLSDGGTIHVWQTNQDLTGTGKDPAAGGTSVTTGNNSWRRSSFTFGSAARLGYARRFADNTLVAVYGSLDEDTMMTIADSVA